MVGHGFRNEIVQGLGAAIGSAVVTAIPLVWGAVQGAPGFLVIPAATVTFASVYWLWTTVQNRFFSELLATPAAQTPAHASVHQAKQKYIPYDLQERLKAVDNLSSMISTTWSDLKPLVEDTRNNWAKYLMQGEFDAKLAMIAEQSQAHFKKYNDAWTGYALKFSEIDEGLRSEWDTQELVSATILLRKELNRLGKKESAAHDDLQNNKFLDHWFSAVKNFYQWAPGMRDRLNSQRKEYEKAEVYH